MNGPTNTHPIIACSFNNKTKQLPEAGNACYFLIAVVSGLVTTYNTVVTNHKIDTTAPGSDTNINPQIQ